MPLFEYRCSDCNTSYEILHKRAEDKDIIECPACRSRSYSKKFSVFATALSGQAPQTSCDPGMCDLPGASCCGGACGMN